MTKQTGTASVSVNLNAELISIGTEILLGEITDTNSVYMARTLRDQGINIFYMISVGDNHDRIADTIRASLERSDIVITCGGLGPTVDDMTRASIATATDRELVFHQDLFDQIAARFAKYGVEMTDNNRQQAYLPAEAIKIENPVGTAPSFVVEVGEKCVISLPGVPREMKFLFEERIIPYLRERYGITEQVILARILKTAGVGESYLDTLVGHDLLTGSNPTVGLAAHSGQIDIRITAKADTRAEAQALIKPIEQEIRQRTNGTIFGVDDEKLESVLAELLRQHDATVGISEAGTNGLIHKQLAPALDEHNLIVEARQQETVADLQEMLGEDERLTLLETAQRAAQQLLEDTDCTLAIVIVSQPDAEESADETARTAVVVSTNEVSRHRVYGFGGRNENTQRFVGNWSTAVAWRLVKEFFNDV